MAETPKQIKYTSKIRRGLAAVAELALASMDDRKPSGTAIVAAWTAAKRQEFNAACDYIDQENKPKAEATTIAPATTFLPPDTVVNPA
jgi:hypothetical protein